MNIKGAFILEKQTAKSIQICMGSACHLKGAPLIAQAFQAELDKRNNTAAVVELGGAFCQSQCIDGVVVRINGEIHTHVTVADVPALIDICLREE